MKVAKASTKAGDKIVGVGIRRYGGKAFRYANGIWVEQGMNLPKEYETKTVVFLSDEYDALSKDATIASWLAAGAQVTFFHDGVLYRNVMAGYAHIHVDGAPGWAAFLARFWRGID